MTRVELRTYLRRVHGITDGTTYDPDDHADVPAICFMSAEGLMDEAPTGQHLRPHLDLIACEGSDG